LSCNRPTISIKHFRQARLPQNPGCKQDPVGMLKFVIQEHDARSRCICFRPGRNSASRTWNLPTGPRLSPPLLRQFLPPAS
jgi:hypothetical protein